MPMPGRIYDTLRRGMSLMQLLVSRVSEMVTPLETGDYLDHQFFHFKFPRLGSQGMKGRHYVGFALRNLFWSPDGSYKIVCR